MQIDLNTPAKKIEELLSVAKPGDDVFLLIMEKWLRI